MSRPRVTARHVIDARTQQALCQLPHKTPGVHVDVTFDLHDHEAALAALDEAVARVRAQIEETR